MFNQKGKFSVASAAAAIMAVLLILLSTTGTTIGQKASGKVLDVDPVILSFSSDATTLQIGGASAATWTGSVRDANGEDDLQGGTLTVTITPPSGLATTATTTIQGIPGANADDESRDEPKAFKDGWKVWPGTADDGTIHFRYRYSLPSGASTGTWSFAVKFTKGDVEATSAGVSQTVALFTHVTTAAFPVDADGNPLDDENWGMWEARPGQENVRSANWIKVTNTGQNPTPDVVVDFSDVAFKGAGTQTEDKIPIDGNLRFAYCIVDAGSSPKQCTFDFGTAKAESGALTAKFDGVARVMFIQYQVVKVPDVIKAHAYGAQFTVNTVVGGT